MTLLNFKDGKKLSKRYLNNKVSVPRVVYDTRKNLAMYHFVAWDRTWNIDIAESFVWSRLHELCSCVAVFLLTKRFSTWFEFLDDTSSETSSTKNTCEFLSTFFTNGKRNAVCILKKWAIKFDIWLAIAVKFRYVYHSPFFSLRILSLFCFMGFIYFVFIHLFTPFFSSFLICSWFLQKLSNFTFV